MSITITKIISYNQVHINISCKVFTLIESTIHVNYEIIFYSTINFISVKALTSSEMDPDDKMKVLSDFSYTINRIAQSLKHGNTNQVGWDAWHLHMQYIVNGVTRFVNHLNRDYTDHGIIINPTNFPNFPFPGLPSAVNTRVYSNAFEISIGIVSSLLDMDDLNDVHTSAIEDIEYTTDDDDDEDDTEAGGAAGGPPDPAGGALDPAGGDAPPPPSSPHTQKRRQATRTHADFIISDGKTILGHVSRS